MLDKIEVLKKLNEVIPNVIYDLNEEINILKDCIKWLNHNQDKLATLFEASEISWVGQITQTQELVEWNRPYDILGIDGSQIYPDKHQGVSCCLLNIGFAGFSYSEQSRVKLKSFPYIYFEHDIEIEFSTENINYLRTGLEFSKSFEHSQNFVKDHSSHLFLCLFDGPLYFWYLKNKTIDLKNKFLSSYIASLKLFYLNRIPIMGFLSAPKNKDIINLIQKGLAEKIIDLGYESTIDFKFITDSDLISLFLPPFSRTPLFTLSSDLSFNYPPHLRPLFCYVNLGTEISRIEFPTWLTQDPSFDIYLKILIDQCKKGDGYPIALSEAHEQAVVKTSERDFFYSALHTISNENSHTFHFSRKSTKKKIIGV